MKFLFLLFPIVFFGQTVKYDYSLDKNDIKVFLEKDTIQYHFQEEVYNKKDGIHMTQDTLYIDDKAISYNKNNIFVDGREYKFKKPIFSKKAYLIDKTSKRILLTFEALYRKKKFSVIKTQHFSEISDVEIKKILKNWSFFKESKYIYYNGSTRMTPEENFFAFFIGLIAG